MSNMEIWDAVCVTDPARTKHVNQRGGFTAIDANYQIEMATKQFGPIGVGWGFSATYEVIGDLIFAHVTMWHGDRENTFGPIPGCADLSSKRIDTDAPKKAMTDGITKGLSQLGFNQDVFAGKFDDNKYVEMLNAKKNAPKPPSNAEIEAAVSAIEALESMDELENHYGNLYRNFRAIAAHKDVVAAKDKRKTDFNEALADDANFLEGK